MSNQSGIPVPKLPRSIFDRSKKRVGTYRKGLIYPVYAKIMKPGDNIKAQIECVARRLVTKSPSFSEERIVYRWFTVPLRVLYKDWHSWMTGFKEYSDNTPFTDDVPRWNPSTAEKTRPQSLWVHLGFPVNSLPDILPADFKRQAYGWIYDTYFRYKPIEPSILEDGQPGTWKGEDLLQIKKDRDFFTTGLPNQQLGEAISLPITGDTTAEFGDFTLNDLELILKNNGQQTGAAIYADRAQGAIGTLTLNNKNPSNPASITDGFLSAETSSLEATLKQALKNNIVSMKDISSATIALWRLAFAKQLQAENFARSGIFPPDIMRMNFGTSPSDDVYGYPEYHGGSSVVLINDEVLQTSQTTEGSPLGEMGGHGMGVGESAEINIFAREFQVVMCLMYIKHDNFYSSQGMSEEDLFISNNDIGWIAYQHVSEQGVPKRSILCASTKKPTLDAEGKRTNWGEDDTSAEKYNKEIFFFQPVYEHMRREINDVVGLMIQEQLYDNTGKLTIRNNLYNWTQAEVYSIEDGKRPAFNTDFLNLKDDNRNYAIQLNEKGELEDNFIIWTKIKAQWSSVLDPYGEPGKIDHLGAL